MRLTRPSTVTLPPTATAVVTVPWTYTLPPMATTAVAVSPALMTASCPSSQTVPRSAATGRAGGPYDRVEALAAGATAQAHDGGERDEHDDEAPGAP